MNYPKPLLIVLGLLALGLCGDTITVFAELPRLARMIVIVMLLARIGGLLGVMMLSRVGFWIAAGFFAVIAGLNILVMAVAGHGTLLNFVQLGVATGCILILLTQYDEFK